VAKVGCELMGEYPFVGGVIICDHLVNNRCKKEAKMLIADWISVNISFTYRMI
jgi:hypothetical protein